MSPRPNWPDDDRRTPTPEEKSTAPEERRSGRDRRREQRIRLSLEVAVPILVRGPDGLQRGLARNISEGGMLVEMSDLPSIGAEVEITITGVHGSIDSPEAVKLVGEVRHHLAWQHVVRGKRQTMRGIGVRFVEKPAEPETLPGWVWSVGQTVH
jgi:Tfp pilus assembly protein PilZ